MATNKEMLYAIESAESNLIEKVESAQTDKAGSTYSELYKSFMLRMKENIESDLKLLATIHALKESEESLQQANENLERRAAELESFNYTVSHDLRAPVHQILGYCRILNEDHLHAVDEEGKGYLVRVMEVANRMSQLISDLLQLSRVGQAELHLKTIDLGLFASSAIKRLQEANPERKVEVRIAREVPGCCDVNLIRIVLENLLGNAWKFTGKSAAAKIEFGMTNREGELIYFVKDNGAGFNMDQADRLFLPFQRLHDDKEYEGTGIGLATVQKIIQRHGGRIWAESKVNRETNFYFTLP